MPLISTSRVSLFAEVAGEGSQVLLLSGTGADLRKRPSPFNSPLARRCKLLAFDTRGCGRSEKPDDIPTMADFADDAAALLDALGWERAHVIGYSFGGMVAQHFALRHAGRIERLVLAATTPGGAGGASYPLHTVMDLPAEERARRMLPVMDTRIHEDALVHPTGAVKIQLEQTMAYHSAFMDEPGALEGRRRQLHARAAHDCFARLGEIRHETLVCGGLYDDQAPREAVRNLATALPHATLCWYPGGHAFSMTCPEFWTDVADFLLGPAS